MKVLLIGANGQIGKHIVDLLQASENHTVRALVRKKEQADALREKGVETVIADLEGSVDALADALKGCDAVVFAAGSGGKTGFDKTLLVDLDGAVKSMEAAELAGVKRYLIVSALQAHNRTNWSEVIKPYYVAKHYADRMLMASGLDYTIIRPGGLLNEPGTGNVRAANNLERGSIPREDVARTVVAALDEPATINRAFDLISGDELISDAIKNI
ncbi:SDR family oxidoreductase [Ornithinibacillus xuwenensis]|uniref:SDR family oxidoreductase n=1 Tax=Ornithinibacillus xuwenensis TaxID=3144668 RepID=A0ABU9XFN5_9BACI